EEIEGSRQKLFTPAWQRRPDLVAAGVPPAVEPGGPPRGAIVVNASLRGTSGAGPGRKMPPSTAGETPAATSRDRSVADWNGQVEQAAQDLVGKTAPGSSIILVNDDQWGNE